MDNRFQKQHGSLKSIRYSLSWPSSILVIHSLLRQLLNRSGTAPPFQFTYEHAMIVKVPWNSPFYRFSGECRPFEFLWKQLKARHPKTEMRHKGITWPQFSPREQLSRHSSEALDISHRPAFASHVLPRILGPQHSSIYINIAASI